MAVAIRIQETTGCVTVMIIKGVSNVRHVYFCDNNCTAYTVGNMKLDTF